MNSLGYQLTLRNTFGPRLLLTIQKSLLVEISFFCVVSDRVAPNQLASFLVAREHLSLRYFIAYLRLAGPATYVAVAGQVLIIRKLVRLLLLVLQILSLSLRTSRKP